MLRSCLLVWRDSASAQQEMLAAYQLALGHWANRELAAGFQAFKEHRGYCQDLRRVSSRSLTLK